MIAEVVGFTGEIETDTSRPDGTPRKLADSSLLRSTGWQPRISLREGLERTYLTFLEEREWLGAMCIAIRFCNLRIL